jgi:hypothetical protein
MNTVKIALSLTFCLAVLAGALPALADSPDDLLIVANLAVPEKSLSLDEVRLVFLKKKRVWSNGQNIIAYHDTAASLRHRFAVQVLGMTLGDEQRYWRDEAVRTALKAPREIETKDHARLRAVFGKKGAISYVLRKDYLPEVAKILAVVPEEE